MTKQRIFRVVYERDNNRRWFVRCPDVHGAHSHGRTLPSSRENIREAIAVVLDIEDSADFELSEEVRLHDSKLRRAIDEATTLRAGARRAEQLASQATRAAISESIHGRDALSNRDLAELLELSHQRVQQLVSEVRQQSTTVPQASG